MIEPIEPSHQPIDSLDPYRTPAFDSTQPQRDNGYAAIISGVLVWMLLACFAFILFNSVRPVMDDFGIELPVLTQWLLHPMATVMCVAIAIAVSLGGVMTEDQQQRKRTGRLAFVLGIVTLIVMLLGIMIPLNSVMNALHGG